MYKVKYNIDTSINGYKAGLVEKGYTQQHGIDYDQNFVLVAKMMTIRSKGVPLTSNGCKE